MKHRSIGGRRSEGEGETKLTFAATTMSVDRMGEVVVPIGCEKTLGDYKENPVLHYGHQNSPFWDGQRESLPIGRCADLRFTKDNEELHYDAEFSKAHEFGQVVKGLVEEGALSATSIGFRPKLVDEEPVLDGQTGVTHLEWHLLENSIVPIPANQHAVRRSIMKSAVVARFKDNLLIPECKLDDGVYKGTSEPKDGHTHSFLVEVREGAIVLGATSIEDSHWHLIVNPGATESSKDHSHTVILERQLKATVREVMLESLGLPVEVIDWNADDVQAIKKFLALRDELNKPDPEAGVTELRDMLTSIGEAIYNPVEVLREAIPAQIANSLRSSIRGE